MDFQELPKIQELPDYKPNRYGFDKYENEPLLAYVWKVENGYINNGDDCRSPIELAIFVNRYIETKLTDEEKYTRHIEIYPSATLESAKEYYSERTKLDTSFKDKFFESKEVKNTIKAFNLDLDKFWYLLLFVKDYVDDCYTNAPKIGLSEVEKVNEMAEKILEATEIIVKKKGEKDYKIQDEYTLSILKYSVNYFIKTYNIIENIENREELKIKLEELGLNRTIWDNNPILFEEKVSFENSHKIRLFADMFQYFLKDLKADKKLMGRHTTREDSTDRLLFISRLAYIVGYANEEYYERYVENEERKLVPRNKLKNLLNKYKKKPLPPKNTRFYSIWC